MNNRKISLWFVLPLFAVSLYGADLPSIQEKTKGMKPYEGFMDFYWNDATGEMFMKIDKFDSELLYIRSLSAGIGSNDIGLDEFRGAIDRSVYVRLSGQVHYGIGLKRSNNLAERICVTNVGLKKCIAGRAFDCFEGV